MAHDQAQNHPPSPEALAQGYEPAAAPIAGLAIFVVGLFVCLGIIWWLNWILMKRLDGQQRSADEPRSAVADQQPPPPPRIGPSPGHDSLPYQDMEAMRQEEDSVFAKLGWQVDAGTHQVVIPPGIVQKVQQRHFATQLQSATSPTANPRGSNTILPGPPATQNIHETGGSPQGPTPNERPDLSDQSTTAAGSGGKEHGPRPERPQP